MLDLTTNVWRVRASHNGGKLLVIDWSLLDRDIRPRALSQKARHFCKLYLHRRLTFSKGHTIRNDFEMFRRFVRFMGPHDYKPGVPIFEWSHLTHSDFRAFLAHGMKTGNKGNDFARLRDFYKWGAFIAEFSDFDRNLALGITNIHAKGNEKGKAVLSRDPLDGPLDSNEQDILINAFRNELGDPYDQAIVMIHYELGSEPQAVARLRRSDFHEFTTYSIEGGRSHVLVRYQIDMPRVKKRKEHRETVPFPISYELGELLQSLQQGRGDGFLFHWLDQNKPETAIWAAMRRYADHANLISPRTGERLKLTPRRFRYTLGTEMARLGASIRRIAIALDHTDNQTVKVYIKTASYITTLLNDAYEKRLSPIVARFRGTIIHKGHRLSQALGTIPATSPLFPILNLGGIGMCGRDLRTDGLCRLAPPLTCYGCNFFAAFRDLELHTEVRDSLIKVTAQ